MAIAIVTTFCAFSDQGLPMKTVRLDARGATLMLSCAIGAPPRVLHWGPPLSQAVAVEDVVRLGTRQAGPGSADMPVVESLAFEPGLGALGPSGLSVHRGGGDWGSLCVATNVTLSDQAVDLTCRDARTGVRLDYRVALAPDTGVLTVGTILTNDGAATLDVADMATAFLPVPTAMTQIIGFTGRWTDEFHTERFARVAGGYVRENRRGRTSHDSFPAVILCKPTTDEQAGEAYGFHLAWSGNHRVRVDTLIDGRVFASMGALLAPGEVRLEPGESFESPQIVAAYSAGGLSALSRAFHRHVRGALLRPSTRAKPRPVHYNTWEAVYFDHGVDKLTTIATRAAALGVERFVLDDGWFGARRDDRAGLGDWFVSDAVYPEGLKPLIDHVVGLGMEMGIWFEPEMVNPDSDLYRAHPDWALRIEGVPQTPYRHQYALDISRREVADYLFERIGAILSEHDIGYIKWDMNRDLNHPGDHLGRPRAHAQVRALWDLLDRLRAAHPTVEIETCSSGGARPDFGMLARTDRIWTSDTNDALDRQAIQRGASFFLPLEVMGAHVGPGHCHQTGRRLSMAMRAGTALMGHMGLELNLLTEPAHDQEELRGAIALYKTHRALLHTGDFHRLDTPDYLNALAVVSPDRSEALFSVAFLKGHAATVPGRAYFPGLDDDKTYRLRLIWPSAWRSSPFPSSVEAMDLEGGGSRVCGEALRRVGLQLPLTLPETVLLFHLEAETTPDL